MSFKEGKSTQVKWCKSMDVLRFVALYGRQCNIVKSLQLLHSIIFSRFSLQYAWLFHKSGHFGHTKNTYVHM